MIAIILYALKIVWVIIDMLSQPWGYSSTFEEVYVNWVFKNGTYLALEVAECFIKTVSKSNLILRSLMIFFSGVISINNFKRLTCQQFKKKSEV